MKKIRKGNDIAIQWEIYASDGIETRPYDLTGKSISLYLKSAFGMTVIPDFAVDKHVVSFMFWGKDQKQSGTYSLVIVENDGVEGMHTLDECNAFSLVNCSCEVGGEDNESIECVSLQLQSNVGVFMSTTSTIEVDDYLSLDSENPVQNKVITRALNSKVDKVSGKQLSTEDFTAALKSKLESLSNYDDKAIREAVDSLELQINTLVGGDASNAIESFNEIIAFLSGIEESASLDNIIAVIEQQIARKQDIITDLETIRSGAAKGATAIQSVKTINGQSIVGNGNIEIGADTTSLATKEEVEALRNEVIDNEEVTAAAFSDMRNFVEESIGNSVQQEVSGEKVYAIADGILSNTHDAYYHLPHINEEDVDHTLATKGDIQSAIASAITTTLNTEV